MSLGLALALYLVIAGMFAAGIYIMSKF